jgi:Domain of unknown function (DUF4157)
MRFAATKKEAQSSPEPDHRPSSGQPAARMPRFLQSTLKIAPPDCSSEREADRAADRLAAGPLPMFLQPGIGSRIGDVRVHTDGAADGAARALNARAFTLGHDIAFAAGEFRPDTAEGRHLLAHELAHVVQQSGGSRGGDGAPALSAAGPSIQRAVRTLGGEWDTTKYDVVNNGSVDIGVAIDLVFKPEDPVNAEMIGVTQTAKSYKGGDLWGTNPVYTNETTKKRAIQSGEAEGTKIDQLAAFGNPLYATGASNPGDSLAGTPTNAFWGQHGWHYVDVMGAAQHQDALLKDKATMNPPGDNAGQTFETTALAVKGAQDGTFYGSVNWGWQTDDSGALTKRPLSVVTTGVPTATFMEAAKLWNANPTSTGAATTALPTSTLPSSTTLPSSRTTSELVIDIARITSELASMVPGIDKTNKEFEKKALEFELAKRADQPTISLADQEKAAALLSTADLIKRATALPGEISGLGVTAARTDKELEREAVHRETRKRKLLVTVHVHETEDVIGADSVYVTARWGGSGTSSHEVNLNNGQENAYVISLFDVFPAAPADPTASPLTIRAFDSDWEGDDLMFEKDWAWSALPADDTQERDGGKYEVKVELAQLR